LFTDSSSSHVRELDGSILRLKKRQRMTTFDVLDQNMLTNDIYFEKGDLIFSTDYNPKPFVYERRVTNQEYIERFLRNKRQQSKEEEEEEKKPEKKIQTKKKGFISQILYKFNLYFFG
jgi:hypothetical protein